MLGLALLFYIGKYFYNLAALNEKSKWGYAILGVVTYYAGTFLFGIILEIITQFGFDSSVDTMNSYMLAFVALPAGIGFAALVYNLLKKQWEKNNKVNLEMITQLGADVT